MVFEKILVANRGEIAIRGFRAAHELGARSVAVFAYEDRNSEHRTKANESYVIGEEGHPVRAYLDIEEILRVAQESGADAIYPGYGFLAENATFARACADAGITFIGPPPEVIDLTGSKTAALIAAREAGLPILSSTGPSTDVDELVGQSVEIGFPLFVKAVAGGGGRGMRRVNSLGELREAIETAMREASAAFGNPSIYLERAVLRPRHVEVQIVGDATGEVVHLYERDCSIQRRHQKVIEIAPAPNLDPELRQQLLDDAVKFAKHIGYVNAGTVEFLIDTVGELAGQHVFIEVNPRIQVEHTVTEEVTDLDLVQMQMRIAAGESLADMGIHQDVVRLNGCALQCRVTTEDPANGFRPDTGRIVGYRSPGGVGVRLDGATATAGSEISAYFDSMLVKLTCRGRDFATALMRAERALGEFRIRGVRTNITFLQAVVADPQFQAGDLSTSFIDERPELLSVRVDRDTSTGILTYLGERTVNQIHGEPLTYVLPEEKLPPLDNYPPVTHGTRQLLDELGPVGWARALREQAAVGVTDTTLRDAHQSLLATRMRTYDLAYIGEHMTRMTPNLLSVECWGGATFDVALRFLGEDPWMRLAVLRETMPTIALQMLLRGRNTVGYTPYPTKVTDSFIKEASDIGLDVFRIFDSLNDVEQMRPAIESVLEQGRPVAEVAMCYTGNLLDPAEDLYTLDYYLRLADSIVETGAHVLAVKDMAGLLRPAAAAKLIRALRERFDLPVHLHTHDTAGGQIATLLAAVDAGVDAVDVASASMAGTTSQPSMSAFVAALANTDRDTGMDLRAVCDLEPYWETARLLYRPFEMGLAGPTGRVYDHEIPGGQLSNLRIQAAALGLGDKFEEIEKMYNVADKLLGRIVKVTPSSKAVGDLALHMVARGMDPAEFVENPQSFDLPESVISFLAGDLGNPPGGWPEPFRTKALAGRNVKPAMVPLTVEDEADLDGTSEQRRSRLNTLLFPGPTRDFERHRATYGLTDVLDSLRFFYGMRPGTEVEVELDKGMIMLVGLEAIGEADWCGMRNVIFTLNGQIRAIQVRDNEVKVEEFTTERANPDIPGHIAAPFSGAVTASVSAGDRVKAGQTVAVIEAMKMEAAITTPIDGQVKRIAIEGVTPMEGGDLVLIVE
jgi:pyruvate carboxylase